MLTNNCLLGVVKRVVSQIIDVTPIVYLRWIMQQSVICGLTLIRTWTRILIWRIWIVRMSALTPRTVVASIVFYVAVRLFPVMTQIEDGLIPYGPVEGGHL
jgi:hypothetical protein